jgi:succinyl-diaminopimelate desuccinylase
LKEKKPIITPGTLIKGGTNINIVPDYCETTVDVRLMPGQTKESIKKEILNCIKKLKQKDPQIKTEIQDLMFIPSVYISENEKFVYINSIIDVCKIYALTAFDFLK